MCGIWLSLGPEAAEAVLAPIAHRGPDGAGWRVFQTPAGPLALGHRRLAIIDTSPAAAQPMSDPDERCWLTYNGEIYNYLELRRELEAEGIRFRTRSDSEVLIACYMRWGAGCLSRLVGMFAFALYDAAAGQVLLARDHFGMKPLYYAVHPAGLVAASEIKALAGFPGIGRGIDGQRLFDFLRYGRTDHGSGTMLSAIRQIPAGHYALIDLAKGARLEPRPYWRPGAAKGHAPSRAESAARLRELFLDSVRLHLRSDVPLGVLLSGGIDSSSILLAARKIAGVDAELPAVSYMADDAALGEEVWIRKAAEAAGSPVHAVRIAAEDLAQDVDRLIAQQDEPLATTSAYAQFRVFRAAHEAGLKVMLDGQGADEMLAGYPTYLSSRLVSLLRAGRFGAAASLLARARQGGRAGALLRAAGAFLPPAAASLARRLVGQDEVPRWIDRAWASSLDTLPREVRTSRHALHDRLVETLAVTSLPALLRYEDRNAMGFSIESRLPFLTVPIAEFVLSLPEDYLIDGNGVTKAVFRDAMRGVVPDAILDRRDKIGFATPQSRWLQGLRSWLIETFDSAAARSFAPLPSAIRKAVLDRLKDRAVPNDGWIWRCASAIRWAELHGARW